MKKKGILLLTALLTATLLSGCTAPAAEVQSAASQPPDPLEEWGLGTSETRHVSLDRAYEWYVDQTDTGDFGNINCGPSCIEMAGKWLDEDFSATAEQIRIDYESVGISGVSVNDLGKILRNLGIKFKRYNDLTEELVIGQIDKGHILILPVNTTCISYESTPAYHINKAYDRSFYHYIIVKGYREVDSRLWFEVNDPFSQGETYEDGQLKGKNRYYLAAEVVQAVTESTFIPNCCFAIG